MASVAGLALTHTVGKAVLSGLFTSKKPFLRTPKCEDPAAISQALRLVWQETTLLGLGILALLAMVFVNSGLEDPAAMLWMTMLAVQTLPYVATVTTAALSALSNARLKSPERVPMPSPPPPALPKAA